MNKKKLTILCFCKFSSISVTYFSSLFLYFRLFLHVKTHGCCFFFIFLERQRVPKSWYWNRITKKKMVMFKGVVDRTALFYCKIYIGWRTVDSKRSYQLFFFFSAIEFKYLICKNARRHKIMHIVLCQGPHVCLF